MSWTKYLNPGYYIGELTKPGELSPDDAARKKLLEEQAAKAGDLADYGQGGFMSLSADADSARAALRDQMTGKVSFAGEQLRQGLQQNQAAQRSLAASAAPQNAAMAARTAAINSARMGSGLAGQQALAGIAERNAAARAYADATLAQRQQELNAALGSRQNAMTGYGAGQPFVPQPTAIQQLVGAGKDVAVLAATKGK